MPDLIGIAIFDRLEKELRTEEGLTELMWRRREIENYFCLEEVLLAYALYDVKDDLFGYKEREKRIGVMRDVINDVSNALDTLGKGSPWSPEIKATDEFLEPLFKKYFKKLELPLELRKASYHQLAGFVPIDRIDPEVIEKLDAIVETALMAKPRGD